MKTYFCWYDNEWLMRDILKCKNPVFEVSRGDPCWPAMLMSFHFLMTTWTSMIFGYMLKRWPTNCNVTLNLVRDLVNKGRPHQRWHIVVDICLLLTWRFYLRCVLMIVVGFSWQFVVGDSWSFVGNCWLILVGNCCWLTLVAVDCCWTVVELEDVVAT